MAEGKARQKPARKGHHAPKKATGVSVYSLHGKVLKSVELPAVFHAPVRLDLIRRAVTAAQANRRQPYGAMFNAGRRHSVRWAGKGRGVSRVPRIRGTMTGAQAPGTVGGARAHPPRVDKVWAKKINEAERRKARAAALAAAANADLVRARGHRLGKEVTLPVILEDKIEKIAEEESPARAALAVLEALGLDADVARARDGRHIRAGRGKMRGRRWRVPSGPLLVVKDAAAVRRAFGNFPGVDVVNVGGLGTEALAPGGLPGRLTVFSESALEALRGW